MNVRPTVATLLMIVAPIMFAACASEDSPTKLIQGRQPYLSGDGRRKGYNHQDNIYKFETISGATLTFLSM
jgi:hypothetical protein